MSTLEVKVLRPWKIQHHPNADRLDLVTFGGELGYTCVTGRDQFSQDSLIIYIPPDAIIPDSMVLKIAANSKVKLENRIRAVKIRGCFSEGLCLDPKEWLDFVVDLDMDVTKNLGIKKWEPPTPRISLSGNQQGQPHYQNPNFKAYDDVEHLKKHPKVLVDGEEVIVEIKTHGTNARFGYVKIDKLSLWKRLLNKIFKLSDMEYLIGSHNTVKKVGKKNGGYYKEDVWNRISEEFFLEQVTKDISYNLDSKSVTIYGEIYGPGIQTGYDYGMKEGELAWKVFDIKVDGKPLDYDDVVYWCTKMALPMWEPCYRGPFSHEKIKSLTHNVIDEYNGKKYNREGTVTRPVKDRKDPRCGRVILKLVNEKYLLDHKNSENH